MRRRVLQSGVHAEAARQQLEDQRIARVHYDARLRRDVEGGRAQWRRR